jgi:hypothetical protein
MSRSYQVAAACVPITLMLWCAAAFAGVTGATITVNPNSYSGSCPTSVQATAVVSGTPGTTFRYAFYRHGSAVLPTVAGTVAPSGTLVVRDSIVLSTTTSDFDEIWISGISGQPDVYSAKAAYTVTCLTPTPAPSGGGRLYGHSNVPHVQALTYEHVKKTLVLQPANSDVWEKENKSCGGLSVFSTACLDLGYVEPYPGYPSVVVGFRYWTDKRLAGDLYDNALFRAGLQFSIPNLQHHTITAATLTLTPYGTAVYQNGSWDVPSSLPCAFDFGPAQSDWWDSRVSWLDGEFGETFTGSGSALTANVVHDVQTWTAYGNNNGWVVQGPDENLAAFTEKECITRYWASLQIEYY